MKIAICTPVHGLTAAGFTHSLTRMLIYSYSVGLPTNGQPSLPQLDYLQFTSSNVAHARNHLMRHALAAEADYIQWLDADMSFPPHTLERLLRVGQPVVGCNYGMRTKDTAPTAQRIRNGKRERVYTDEKLARKGAIERIHSMGMGICLVRADAARATADPYFEWGPHGEDGYFFDQLAAADIPVFVDHALSWECSHIGERVITLNDTLKTRMRANLSKKK